MTTCARTEITDWAKWNAVGRPHVFWGHHPKLRSMRAYLVGVKSRYIRSLVTAAARRRHRGRIQGMDRQKRECLHDAICEVMDHFESMNGGQPDDPRVSQLNIALNLVADDLRWNDEGAIYDTDDQIVDVHENHHHRARYTPS